MLRVRVSLCHAVVLFAVFAGGFAAHAAAPIATVQTASGRFTVQRGGRGEAQPARQKTGLNPNDIVATGPASSARLFFTGGTTVTLQSNTKVHINSQQSAGRGKNGLFSVIFGEITARLQRGQKIPTKSATLAVVGTEIHLTVAEDETTTVSVIEGEVEFFNELGRVLVGEKQQSTARLGQAPTAPVTVANPGLIVEWRLDLDSVATPRERFFRSSHAPTLQQQLPSTAALARAAPMDSEPQRNYGDALFDLRRFEEALAAYRQAEKDPKVGPALQIRLGYALLETGEFDQADATFAALPESYSWISDARNGRAAVALARGQYAAAERIARAALALLGTIDETNAVQRLAASDLNITLGLALLRQGKPDESRAAFTAAVPFAVTYKYQALSWLGIVALAQNDTAAALKYAREAVKEAPRSALAQGNLALVAFFAGQPGEATRAARAAVAANPDSAAAQVVFGQAMLARGDTDKAAASAARAIAFDGSLVPAYYLLGVANAARRNYRHATRALERALQLAPDFLPAASALARVYTRQNRNEEALAVLTGVRERRGDSDIVLAALGEIYFEQGRYPEARAQYDRAIALNPSSALTYAGLARLALDANQLNDAIRAGQRAVQLAPDIGQYHAVLGLAYSYSRLDAQAEREYRTALALDPQNALALARLALLNEEGDDRTAGRTAGLTFAQSFLYDPAISRQLLRGGIKTEAEARVGPDDHGLSLRHRAESKDGSWHLFARTNLDKDDGDRANADTKLFSARVDATEQLDAKTNVYVHGLHRRDKAGAPGFAATPSADDRAAFSFHEGSVATRTRFGAGNHLWLGAFANTQKDSRLNPGDDLSFVRPRPPVGLIEISRATARSQAFEPEARLDFNLSDTPARPSVLSLGYARPRTKFRTHEDLGIPAQSGTLETQQEARTSLGYVRVAQQVNGRFSYSAQLRRQRIERTAQGQAVLPFFPQPAAFAETRSYWLPSLAANYRVGARTGLRLLASRRVTDVTGSLFAPPETILTTEGQTLPTGLPETTNVIEADFERYLAAGTLKLFVFHASARNVLYDASSLAYPNDIDANGVISAASLSLNRVKRDGAGVRFERQLGRSLFGQLLGSYNRTTATAGGAGFNNQQAPYHPKYVAGAGLNYVDARGNKAALFLNHSAGFYQDATTAAGPRPRFPAKTTLDLTLAREPSVRNEVYLQITNLFDTRQIAFNDVPLTGRRIRVGAIRRF